MPGLLAIDPGTEQSAWCDYSTEYGITFGTLENPAMLGYLRRYAEDRAAPSLAVEMVASYGMPVGREVFETCVWIGRFLEAFGRPYRLVYRREVKLHVCASPKANDATIRQALIDRFGPGKERAIGTKKAPGPLYGMKADEWAALAVAVTAAETEAPDAS